MVLAILGGLTLSLLVGDGVGVEVLGRLDHPPIREASGLVASRRHPGAFWAHNDSGNPPALFAVRRDGSLIREYRVAAPNIDWEDIAIDDAGHLYLGDIGNNGGRLPLRMVYRLDEPDPSQPAADDPLPTRLAAAYRFPPSGRFDAEGMVLDGSRLLVISKRHDGGEATVFRLPGEGTTTLLTPGVTEQVAILKEFVEPVTGADLTPNGRLLAVASYGVARVYARVAENHWERIGTVHYEADGVEAIAWDGADLILAGEGRGLYRVAESVWKDRAIPAPSR